MNTPETRSDAHEIVATALGQLVGIALLMGVPVGIAAYLLMQKSRARVADTGWDPGMMIVAMTVLLIVSVCGAMILRRSIELYPDALTVRHSYYTLKIARKDVSAVEVTELQAVGELGLTLKTNGVAAFGYLSGWFRTRTGAKIFCAVSARPLYLVTFTSTRLDCAMLALSCSSAMAEKLRRWT